MAVLKGIRVILIEEKEIGEDPFGRPIYEDREVPVENVLVSPASSDDVVNSLNLEGKKAVYNLAIPKGDKNIWEGKRVKFFGKTWKVFGKEILGIEELIPLDWNKKVMVEAYE